MLAKRLKIGLGVIAVLAIATVVLRKPIGRYAIETLSKPYAPRDADTSAPTLRASVASSSARPGEARGEVVLEKVAEGFSQPTDLQFLPGSSQQLVVLEKGGTAHWLQLDSGKRGPLLQVDVRTASEEGLLGLAFHPRFAQDGRFYIHYTPAGGSTHRSRIAAWKHDSPGDLGGGTATETRVLLEVEQPYQNHNAGQLAFGPDGMLYIAMGDGGLADDPDDNGQDLTTLLGSMLRVDVDNPQAGLGYGIPSDNPFLEHEGARPELWAIGLRNPWRFTFAPDGRMIVADVGQDAWEEIDIVRAGDNLGWSVREGYTCFHEHADCGKQFIEPIHVYGRDIGLSLTGGHVYTGDSIAWLRGHYLFADFISGRFFALPLPASREVPQGGLPAIALGRWPVLPSAFGIDARGEVYVATFAHGIVYRLANGQVPATASPPHAGAPAGDAGSDGADGATEGGA
jgi:glucose/arabinose dehydrogenase